MAYLVASAGAGMSSGGIDSVTARKDDALARQMSIRLVGALHQQIVTRNSCNLVTLRFHRPGQGHSPT
jgi:hypothetical protein